MTIILPQLIWRASPNYSSRGGQKVRLIVSHDCEGNYAGSISWFAMARSRVSAHIVLRDDGAEATQMVAWANKAWHVVDFNPYSEGIEAAGFSAKGLGAPEWKALANITAFRLKANKIPCQHASAANDWTGYCQHVDLGAAGGGHRDISSDSVVIAAFDKLVEAAYNDPSLPTSWIAGQAPQPEPGPRHDFEVGSLGWVQMELNALGYARPPLTVDEMDGPATRRAIRSFQERNGLVVDGLAGPLTTAAIEKDAQDVNAIAPDF